MFIKSIHGIIILETDIDLFVNDIFKSIKDKYKDLDNEMKGSEFSYKLVSKLNIRCEKVNFKEGSSYIKSPNWLRYKNATINPKVIGDINYTFAFTQHHKEIKNHFEEVSIIKPYLDLFNWMGVEYPTGVNKNNDTLIEKINSEISLVVLYADADVKVFKDDDGVEYTWVHKSL